MKFLVIKHLLVEGLGIFEQFCHDSGIDIDTVELEKQEAKFCSIISLILSIHAKNSCNFHY